MTQANLFDPPVRGHRPTRSDAVKNRREGYEKAGERRRSIMRRMLDAYEDGPLTDAEMAERLGVQRTTIIARRHEMTLAVGEKGSKKNPSTGVMNTLFGLSERSL